MRMIDFLISTEQALVFELARVREKLSAIERGGGELAENARGPMVGLCIVLTSVQIDADNIATTLALMDDSELPFTVHPPPKSLAKSDEVH